MNQCCLEGCGTSSDKDVTYFDFPTSRMLRKRWLDAIGCGKLAGEPRLCSRHFAPHEYEHVRGRTRLRGKVLPTLCLDSPRTPKLVKDPLASTGSTEEESQGSTDKESTKTDINNGNKEIDNVDNAFKSDGEKPPSPSRENGHNDTNHIEKDVNDTEKADIDGTEVKLEDVIDKDKDKAGTKRVAEDKTANKKVKKKWVAMRARPGLNGHVSEDSSSQDSVNSEVPPQPILEDLEEHLPNYQIANMKTERQVAAMTDTIEPIEELVSLSEYAEEITVEPHVPVFIELSVGQDNSAGSEQANDCLMVMESVECDIDPTLMLEARAEDEECCEQIDLDDDDVMSVNTDAENDNTTKKSVDPISLLTSSDEDDVILQEPHIDTLSVSDETDEDDLPLQKLIKREKKAKKRKKKKKQSIKSILVCATDFFCTYCQHVSSSKSSHDKHLKTHLNEPRKGTSRVYQICNDCGVKTTSRSQLCRHQRKHLKEKRFKCPLCSYRSKYNMSLMYHLKTHNYDPNMYNCGACGLQLDSKMALLEHQSSCYEMSKKFLCAVCGYVALTKRALKSHRSTVHNHKV